MTFTDRERRYLHEMGIDVWVSRSERQLESVPVPPAEADPAVKPKASVAREGTVLEARGLPSAGAHAAAAPVAEPTPRVVSEFRLDLDVCCSGELLALGSVIDAMDARLLQNIVLAATVPPDVSRVSDSSYGGTSGRGSSGDSSELPQLSSFRWPQVKTMGATGEEVAAKALRAYLLRQINENGTRRVLLLGDALAQLMARSEHFVGGLKQRDGSSVPTLKGPDLRYLRYNGDAKRELWQELSRWRS